MCIQVYYCPTHKMPTQKWQIHIIIYKKMKIPGQIWAALILHFLRVLSLAHVKFLVCEQKIAHGSGWGSNTLIVLWMKVQCLILRPPNPSIKEYFTTMLFHFQIMNKIVRITIQTHMEHIIFNTWVTWVQVSDFNRCAHSTHVQEMCRQCKFQVWLDVHTHTLQLHIRIVMYCAVWTVLVTCSFCLAIFVYCSSKNAD